MPIPPILEGRWLTEIEGWQVDFLDTASNVTASWTHESPDHPFSTIDLELDGIGCLSSANLPLTRPLHLLPFAATVRLWALDAQHGWVRLAEGLVERPLDKLAQLSELTLTPLETLVMRWYYNGSMPPMIDGVTVSAHNLAGISAPSATGSEMWTKTNDQVIGDAMRADPTATIGVDAYRRMILARPRDGSPVVLNSVDLYDVQPSSYEFPPYGTGSRLDPGPGWLKREYRIDRGPLVPKVAVEGGSVEFKNEVRGAGPPLVNAKTLTLINGTPALEDLVWKGEDLNFDVEADAFACVLVYDLKAWYQSSALLTQDQEAIKAAADELSAARMILGQRVAWYGSEHHFTQEARLAQASAQATLSAVQNNAVAGESDYEPLTGLLTMGLQPRALGQQNGYPSEESLTLEWVMWVSKVPWDEASVGIPATDSDAYSLIHPKGQPQTVKVLKSMSGHYGLSDINRPSQPVDIPIPPELFTQNQGRRITETLAANWKDSFKPDAPPEDESPPVWDGKWYLHIGCTWGRDISPGVDA